MIPLFSQTDFDRAGSRDMLRLQCAECGKEFLKAKHMIQPAIKGVRRQTSDFCSITCKNRAHKPSTDTTVTCAQCDTKFTKKACAIKQSKSGRSFCSRSCAAKYNNAHKKYGTRVSKLERWLAEQLPVLFPDLEFHFNRKDAINSELDIYIPELKLAFELNGIFHYEPIYGPEKLASIQNNDERKFQACIEAGIELCIIDVSSFKYFKPKKAKKYLDIVSDIILGRSEGT